MAEKFCKVPGCPEPGPYKSSRSLGNHRRSEVHQGAKVCEICGEEYGYIVPHRKHCKGPEAAPELHWDPEELEDREHWKERALKAEDRADKAESRVQELEGELDQALEDSKRRLRNDKRFRKLLKQHGIPVPSDLEKQ